MSGVRAARFTPSEDLELCRAFIAASEDETVGTDQKSADFQKKMQENYVALLREHNSTNGTNYPNRAAHSNYARFRKVSKYLLKYKSCEETAGDPPSGDNDKIEWLKCIKETYYHRNPTSEAKNILENILYCKDFLYRSPKWQAFEENNDEGSGGSAKKNRPMGSKRAKQAQSDEKLIRKVVSLNKDEKAKKKYRKNKEAFMSKVGDAITASMEQRNDAQLLQMCSPASRNMFAKQIIKEKIKQMKLNRTRGTAGVSIASSLTINSSSSSSSDDEDDDDIGKKAREKEVEVMEQSGEDSDDEENAGLPPEVAARIAGIPDSPGDNRVRAPHSYFMHEGDKFS